MPTGFLVTLGDSTIDPGDTVSNDATTTFTQTVVLGTGSVRWANSTPSGSGSATISGQFVEGDDGNVYFIPGFNPPASSRGGTATVQSFTPAPPPCFTAGTLITTPHGRHAVETLRPGDYVITKTGAPEPVLWAGHRTMSRCDLERSPNSRPIEIKLGDGPTPLRLSPQHALWLTPDDAALLVRARQLAKLGLYGAREMKGIRQVRYHHLLLPRHCLIQANGIWCESFWPGPRARAGLPTAQRDALDHILSDGYGPQFGRYGTLKEIRTLWKIRPRQVALRPPVPQLDRVIQT